MGCLCLIVNMNSASCCWPKSKLQQEAQTFQTIGQCGLFHIRLPIKTLFFFLSLQHILTQELIRAVQVTVCAVLSWPVYVCGFCMLCSQCWLFKENRMVSLHHSWRKEMLLNPQKHTLFKVINHSITILSAYFSVYSTCYFQMILAPFVWKICFDCFTSYTVSELF